MKTTPRKDTTTPMAQTVTLACDSPCSVFDPSIEGIQPITQDGTTIPKAKAKTVRARAKANGVQIRTINTPTNK